MSESRGPGPVTLLVGALLAFGAGVAFWGVYWIPEGSVGAKTSIWRQPGVTALGPGVAWALPFTHRVEVFPLEGAVVLLDYQIGSFAQRRSVSVTLQDRWECNFSADAQYAFTPDEGRRLMAAFGGRIPREFLEYEARKAIREIGATLSKPDIDTPEGYRAALARMTEPSREALERRGLRLTRWAIVPHGDKYATLYEPRATPTPEPAPEATAP